MKRAVLALAFFAGGCSHGPKKPPTPVTWDISCALTCDSKPSKVTLQLCKPDDLTHDQVIHGSEVSAQILFAVIGCTAHTEKCTATPSAKPCDTPEPVPAK